MTKCSSGQAITDLGAAFANFFRDLKKPKKQRRFRHPRFKKKRMDQGFALWNDQFAIEGARIRIPLLGWVRLREPLRFNGKIMGGRISNIGGRWMVSVQIDTDFALAPAPDGTVVGVDFGLTTFATLSRPMPDGRRKVEGPKARKRLLGRVRKMQRRISLQKHRAQKASNRQRVRQERLRKLHYRIACIRKECSTQTHHLTREPVSDHRDRGLERVRHGQKPQPRRGLFWMACFGKRDGNWNTRRRCAAGVLSWLTVSSRPLSGARAVTTSTKRLCWASASGPARSAG